MTNHPSPSISSNLGMFFDYYKAILYSDQKSKAYQTDQNEEIFVDHKANQRDQVTIKVLSALSSEKLKYL